MSNYKYNQDEMRSILLENMYKVRGKAAKFRDFCDEDECLARSEGMNTAFYDAEMDKYDEFIAKIDEIIDIFR